MTTPKLPTIQLRFEMPRSDCMHLWIAMDGLEGEPVELNEDEFVALAELWESANAIVQASDARRGHAEPGRLRPLLTDPFALRGLHSDDPNDE
ncbi:MAG TPA: hypothetical protein VFX59_15330 [Polyangiales bacterium]|nr:hypothetical protein [Polyangiales bacterium]